jgi:hypothetical protein
LRQRIRVRKGTQLRTSVGPTMLSLQFSSSQEAASFDLQFDKLPFAFGYFQSGEQGGKSSFAWNNASASAYVTQNDVAARSSAEPSKASCVGEYDSVGVGELRCNLISSNR